MWDVTLFVDAYVGVAFDIGGQSWTLHSSSTPKQELKKSGKLFFCSEGFSCSFETDKQLAIKESKSILLRWIAMGDRERSHESFDR